MFLTQSEIVSQINAFVLCAMGVGAAPNIDTMKALSLQDMLDAVRQVERDNAAAKNRTPGGGWEFQVVPDDRLTAAVYAWLHYCAPGQHDADDDDDAIVALRINGTVHGLVKYARRID